VVTEKLWSQSGHKEKRTGEINHDEARIQDTKRNQVADGRRPSGQPASGHLRLIQETGATDMKQQTLALNGIVTALALTLATIAGSVPFF